jgi:glycerophosphoryl diester phosphodiesterase
MSPLFVLMVAATLLSPAFAWAQSSLSPQLSIAHRGASAYAPEHTFFAYDLAMEMDADMLECDLFISADEVPVCIHDTTVDRTSNGSGRVEDLTLAQLRELDFGSWFGPEYAGASIVPFEEQMDCYLRHNPRMRFHVETKDSAGGRAEAVLVDVLSRKGLIDTGDLNTSTIVMQSFDAASLERIKSLAPTLPTAFLFAAPTSLDVALWVITGSGPDYIDAFAPNSAAILADPSSVQRYHANGHHVHTWTVNDRNQMELLLGLGVDGIFTDQPDVLRAAIDSVGEGTTPADRANPMDFARGCPGVAGRVSSNLGPGDVWAPHPDGRGVVLVSEADLALESEAPTRSDLRAVGGSLNITLFLLLLPLLARLHMRSGSVAPPKLR